MDITAEDDPGRKDRRKDKGERTKEKRLNVCRTLEY